MLYGWLRKPFGSARIAQADDALSRAMAAAETADRGRFSVPGEPAYFSRVLALAYHLTPADPAAWAAFGSARIAAWLDLHRDTIDDAVGLLEERKLIRVHRDAAGKTIHSGKKKQARGVRYIGPVPTS